MIRNFIALKPYVIEYGSKIKNDYKFIVNQLIQSNIITNYYIENDEYFIPKNIHHYLLDYRFYKTDAFVYMVSKQIISELKKSITYLNKYNTSKILKPLPAINNYGDFLINDLDKEIAEEQVKYNFKDYFITNASKSINYNNTKQLKYIQDSLLSQLYNSKDLNPNAVKISNVKGYYNSCLQIGYWTFRGWSYKEAKEKIANIQSINANHYKNKKIQNPEKYKSRYSTSLEYWLNLGYDEHTAKIKLRERQSTFTLEKCMSKYGKERGLEVFRARQEKWQKSLHEKANYIEIVQKRQNFKGYSHISQELFHKIKEILESNSIFYKLYYAENGHEYGFGINSSIKGFRGCLYDFTIKELNFMIEFNGATFHPNPNMDKTDWKLWENPLTKQTADEAYALDLEKINAAKNKGFDVFIVWDNEYLLDKNKIINNIIKEIKFRHIQYSQKQNEIRKD